MDWILHPDVKQLVYLFGPFTTPVIAAIIFAESGLFVGAFLPGDSLLFASGFLASQGFLNIYILIPALFISAIAGDSVGYTFGHKVGRKLFRREDSIFFHKKHLIRAEKFYEKHGGKTILIARFLPIVRTFAPIVAGMGSMKYKKFLAYNVVGAFLWAVLITLAGYFLGRIIPNVDKYLLPILGFIIFISIAPTVLHILMERRDRKIVEEKVEEVVETVLKK